MSLVADYAGCPLCGAASRPLLEADCAGHPSWTDALPPRLAWRECNACGHVHTRGYWTREGLAVLLSRDLATTAISLMVIVIYALLMLQYDLVLSLDGRRARVVASQGQHRAITLALKAAEVATIGRVRGLSPVLLLDDVSSELDAERTDALFSYLTRQEGQIFVTTTRRSLILLPDGLASAEKHFTVTGGSVGQTAADPLQKKGEEPPP